MCIKKPAKKEDPATVKKQPSTLPVDAKDCPKVPVNSQGSPLKQPISSKTSPEKIPDQQQQQQVKSTTNSKKQPAKSSQATPKKLLPPADENDTVYGFKSSLSDRIFDKDPEIEKSEYEKAKLCGK